MTRTDERLLGGRYQLGESLGQGDLTQVWVGTDIRLGRTVAVKLLRTDLPREPAFGELFRRQAQAAAALSAPQIVAVYDTGTDQRRLRGRTVPVLWVVTELVEGRTLREILSEQGRLAPARALELVAEVCAALQVAHDAGTVHGGITPGNVMLTETGAVKVTDFGIARAVFASSPAHTESASALTTAAYLSPEQARGEHLDARSDLYSTGCLLYELLTGSPPFVADSAVAVAYQHARQAPVPPSEQGNALPRGVDTVVLKAIAKNPAHRYASAEQMAADLLRAARGRPVLATPVGSVSEAEETDPAPAANPGEVSTRTRAICYTLAAAILIGYMIFLATGMRAVLAPDPVERFAAPTLLGRSETQALTVLSQNGLLIGDITPTFSSQPVGQVLAQEPRAGILVDDDRQVDLVVSQGPRRSVIPPLVGRTQDEAAALLAQVGLTVSPELLFRNGFAPEGTVLAVVPAAGTVRPSGTAVTLVLASGNMTVPNVLGAPLQEAAIALQRAGFNVAIRYVDNPGPSGVVLSQNPPAEQAAEVGTDVMLEVSQTPAAVVQTPSPSPSPSPTAEPSTGPGLFPGFPFGPR